MLKLVCTENAMMFGHSDRTEQTVLFKIRKIETARKYHDTFRMREIKSCEFKTE